MVQNAKNKILVHACCGICAGYSIQLLKDMGYLPIVYFCNPNIDTEEEFNKRLEALKIVCMYHWVDLIIEEYVHEEFLSYVKGLEAEPEKGMRCSKCIELRLKHTADKAKELGINRFTTTLTISPHKNSQKIFETGKQIFSGTDFLPIDFKKKDGFLKTNQLARDLGIYRQNYCGCEFAKSHLN